MLNLKNLDDKTYDQHMSEAIMKIPLYSEEWTNFNASDPGITILENLTAFQSLQQSTLNEITPMAYQNMLRLVGFEAAKGRCARILLSAMDAEEPFVIPSGQQFYLGDLCFETNRMMEVGGRRIEKLYRVSADGESRKDLSLLTQREVLAPQMIFGERPQAGDQLYLLCNSLPAPGEEVNLYVTVADENMRNKKGMQEKDAFAFLKWECYTEDGFVPMNVRDHSGAFLVNGEIRMRIPETPAAPYPEEEGNYYVLRATLEKAEYDVIPRVMGIESFLFEVFQRKPFPPAIPSTK